MTYKVISRSVMHLCSMKQSRHQSQVCHTSVLYGMAVRSLHFCNIMMHHRINKFWYYERANFNGAEGPGRFFSFEMLESSNWDAAIEHSMFIAVSLCWTSVIENKYLLSHWFTEHLSLMYEQLVNLWLFYLDSCACILQTGHTRVIWILWWLLTMYIFWEF